MVHRKAAVAGYFYPRFKDEVISIIEESFFDSDFGLGKSFEDYIKDIGVEEKNYVIGGVCPHAGYVYSAPAALKTVSSIFAGKIPDTIIVLGTQHTGYYNTATMIEGSWETPLGNMEIDSEIAKLLCAKVKNFSPIIEDDAAFIGFPHGREHNIEVQLPLIQYCGSKLHQVPKIVPIKIGDMNLNKLDQIGDKIVNAISDCKKKIAIIASSDMTHYQPKDPRNPEEEIMKNQYKRDELVIDSFIKQNRSDTWKYANDTTVCGPQTIITLMYIAEKLGYNKAKKLGYYTSFEKMGRKKPCDYSVGYFSGIIMK